MDDEIWRSSLDEASSVLLPFNLRHYFCTLLIYGEVADANQLYNDFKEDMSHDLSYRMEDWQHEVRLYAEIFAL